VDHGTHDITHLMRNTVAAKLHAAFASDDDIGNRAHFLDGTHNPANATCAALIACLKQHKPAVIVTSSHGKTGPLNNSAALIADLGLPVDQTHQTLDPNALLIDWEPSGSVWFAQACCSAGSDSPSAYRGLFEPNSDIGTVLDGVAKNGAHVAPLPMRLLGCEK